ncbi:MAG: hypothetical protein JWQ23_982 [Herminiimonas sp.]|nr:hypothetical protein [Herminiimonas sp.]
MNTRLKLARILSLLMFTTLSGASSSAFAQSAEYRMGYDQGFRDGISAAQQGRSERGERRRGGIEIEDAYYGVRGASCDLRDTLRRNAIDKRRIDITANNRLCGDPAPGQRKRLVVSYRCGGGPVLRSTAGEGEDMTISCR